MLQREMDVRMGQREPREGLGEVPYLGLRRAEELLPHRRVEEQVAHFDRRAARRLPIGAERLGRAADDFQLGRDRRVGGAASKRQAG